MVGLAPGHSKLPPHTATWVEALCLGRVADRRQGRNELALAATTDGIRQALHRIAVETREDDVLLIYFAGHGQTDFRGEMFYFATAVSAAEHLNSTGLSTAMLADALREMNARRVVLFLDSCQDGGPIEALQRVAQGRAMMAMARHHAGLGS